MDSIEFVLKKDSENKEISLENMSLEASKSLKEVLEALIAIAEYEEDLNLSIGLEKGSAIHKLIGLENDLQVVYNKIEDAANSSPNRDNHYVNTLNVIHKSLDRTKEFDIIYKSQEGERSIKSLFNRKFRNKRVSDLTENYFELEFFNFGAVSVFGI